MTKAVPDGRAELLAFQEPIFEQAMQDGKSFDEAVALAKSEPWPTGLTKTTACNVRFYESVPEDKEAEKRKREERARLAKAEKAERARKKALKRYTPETDAMKVTIHHLDSELQIVRSEIAWEGARLCFASRVLGRTDVVTSNGERLSEDGFKVLLSELTHLNHLGNRIQYMKASDEVLEAIRLPLAQRQLFGAAKDRGLSDAEALAIAKGITTMVSTQEQE